MSDHFTTYRSKRGFLRETPSAVEAYNKKSQLKRA